MERRLKTWNRLNNVSNYHNPNRTNPVSRFFQEKETEIFEIDSYLQEMEIFEAMRIYTERHGRPFNYLPSVEHLHVERMAKLENAETDLRKESELEAQFKAEQKEKDVARLEKLVQDRIVGIQEHVKAEHSVKDMKLREYLMRNLVPILSDAMIDTTKVAPIDPIDYMAEYIFRRSNDERKKERFM